jgi:BMFP domain-containing protein YqiC
MADRPFSDATPNATMSSAIETLTARLSDALAAVLPAGADWQSRLSPVIETTLGRLELVPREDFERQRQQLERLTRDVAKLEARIGALEPRTPH